MNQVLGASALFSFEGRIGTGTFWKIAVLNFIGVVLGAIAAAKTSGGIDRNAITFAANVFVYGVGFWLSCATQAKRWHDLDKSGWMALLNMIPGVNFFVFLYLGFKEGTKGPNKYGEAPLEIELL